MLRLSHTERPMSRRLRADDTGFDKKFTPEAGRFNTLFRGEASGKCTTISGRGVPKNAPHPGPLPKGEREPSAASRKNGRGSIQVEVARCFSFFLGRGLGT